MSDMSRANDGRFDPDAAPRAPALRFTVLGALNGWLDGAPIDLGPARQRAVLALLLAHAGQPVSLDRLVEMLWESETPHHPTNIVHKHIGSLRRLGDPHLPRRSQGDWLLSTTAGYRVESTAVDIDLHQFRSLASAAGGSEAPRERLRRALAALAVWSGPPAQDVAETFRRDPVFSALICEYRDMVIEAADCALGMGRVPQVIDRLRLAVRICPTDELVHSQLMRCLAEDGQRSDALEVYETLGRRLLAEVGVEPGDAVRRVVEHVLDQASFNREIPLR